MALCPPSVGFPRRRSENRIPRFKSKRNGSYTMFPCCLQRSQNKIKRAPFDCRCPLLESSGFYVQSLPHLSPEKDLANGTRIIAPRCGPFGRDMNYHNILPAESRANPAKTCQPEKPQCKRVSRDCCLTSERMLDSKQGGKLVFDNLRFGPTA